MRKTIGYAVLLILTGLLQGGCAEQTVGRQPTSTTTPRTQELTPEEVSRLFAVNLNQKAIELYQQGRYAIAISLVKQALAINEQVLGPEHSETATSLNNLAAFYNTIGAYQQAEPLYQRALTIKEQTLGPEHTDTATSLNNLATLYEAMGAYQQAEPLYQRALAIFEQVLGPENPEIALSLNHLARLYYNMGAYQQAEPLQQRALAIREQVLGAEHPDTASSLNNLATLYEAMGGAYQQVEPLLQQALAIREQVLGPEHPDTAASLNNLATLYKVMGSYQKAEPLYQRALAILEQVFGAEHPDIVVILVNLALLHTAEGRYEQAWRLFTRAQRIDEALIDQIMGFSSENQKLAFLATRQKNLESDLSLIIRHLSDDPEKRRDGLDLWLRRKGVILASQKRYQQALFQANDPEALKIFQELSQLRTQLMQLTFTGPGKEKPEAYEEHINSLKAQKDGLEAELSRLSQSFAAQQQRAKADTKQAATALSDQSALIEFAKIKIRNFKTTGTEPRWQPAHYIVFVLHAGQPEQVGLIDLGEAAPIDSAIEELRARIKEHRGEETAKTLYDLVFAPLLPELGVVKELFISPDGNLNLIPFEVLIGPKGRFLIEDYNFTYLAAGRDLIGNDERVASRQPPLILGDPDFDLASLSVSDPVPAPSVAESGLTVNMNRSGAMPGFNFTRLPGTREEVETIHDLMGEVGKETEPTPNPSQEGSLGSVRLYTGKDALEEALMKAEAPRILHLATHGFFLEDQEFALEETRAISSEDEQRMPKIVKDVKTGLPIENPLLRSGIVLAGVNPAIRAGRTDGLITAEKILGLKLQGTELVVLSACETGLGDVQVGEGVYGLRRAFLQAGAQSLVMSLWSVPDVETKELMTQFYRNFLSGGMPRNQALRQAMQQQMDVVKQRYGKVDPFYWGAFIFLGTP